EAKAAGVGEELRVHRGRRARDDRLVARNLLEELLAGHLGGDLLDVEAPIREVADALRSDGVDDQRLHEIHASTQGAETLRRGYGRLSRGLRAHVPPPDALAMAAAGAPDMARPRGGHRDENWRRFPRKRGKL